MNFFQTMPSLRVLRGRGAAFFALLRRASLGHCAVFCAALLTQAGPAQACEGAEHIRLRAPVKLSAQERAEWRALPPLQVVAVTAPPMMLYDAERDTYTGISADVLCFIAQETGLRYEYITAPVWTVAEKIQRVQEGQADVFVPLSRQPEREVAGVFTTPYYESPYAVIARKGRRLTLRTSADLVKYRVGLVKGVALERIIETTFPTAQLHSFTSVDGMDLFQALRDDAIDVAVFNRDFFVEKRYINDLFDLEVIHTLAEFPRSTGFISRVHQSMSVSSHCSIVTWTLWTCPGRWKRMRRESAR